MTSQRTIKAPFLFALLFAFFSYLPSSLAATKIYAVRGNKVIVQFDGTSVKKGDILRVYDANRKGVGLIKIIGIKGKRGFAKLKGKAEKGFLARVVKRKGKKPTKGKQKQNVAKAGQDPVSGDNPEEAFENPRSKGPKKLKLTLGAMVGYTNNTMDIEESNQSYSLSGSSISFKGYGDIAINQNLGVRVMAGLQAFEVSGNDSVGDSREVTINYITLDALARYNFSPGKWNPWAGFSFGIYLPSSSETNALDNDTISTTNIYGPAFGIDYQYSDKLVIPIQFDYGIYPPSDNVTATSLGLLRAGIGYRF